MTPDTTATVSIATEDDQGVMCIRSWTVSRDRAEEIIALAILGEPDRQTIADLSAQDQVADALRDVSGLVTDGDADG